MTRRTLWPIALLVVFAFLAGCSSAQHNKGAVAEAQMGAPMMARSMDMASSPQSAGGEQTRSIIKTANLEIETRDPEQTAARIESVVLNEGGRIQHSNRSDDKRVYMNVSVPEDRLDGFLENLSGLGTLVSQSINTQDVTEQMVDMEARLANLYALRDRYRTLLERATQVSDMVEIERRLAEVQGQIDSIESRRNYLSTQVAYSQVSITISQQTVYGPLGVIAKGIGWGLKKLFVWN